MIDIDDVGDGFLFGGIIVGVIFLVIYLAWSEPKIDDCEEKGGVTVKSNGDLICVDKSALIGAKK
jgi:hypothetical protein